MKQYQFSLKDECMKELPSMKEPKSYTGHPDNDHEIILYINRLAEYEKHLASLQSLPVPKEYLSSFVDGKIYNEDEFEINENHRYADGFEKGGSFMDKIAIPKQKVDDIELPFLNLGFEIKFIKNELLPPNTAMVSEDIYEILKNNYQNK